MPINITRFTQQAIGNAANRTPTAIKRAGLPRAEASKVLVKSVAPKRNIFRAIADLFKGNKTQTMPDYSGYITRRALLQNTIDSASKARRIGRK